MEITEEKMSNILKDRVTIKDVCETYLSRFEYFDGLSNLLRVSFEDSLSEISCSNRLIDRLIEHIISDDTLLDSFVANHYNYLSPEKRKELMTFKSNINYWLGKLQAFLEIKNHKNN